MKKNELYDPENPDEVDACMKILAESFKGGESRFIPKKGLVPHYGFVDFDKVITNKETVRLFVDLLVKKINELYDLLKRTNSHRTFNKIAIADKGGVGPVGLMSLFAELATRLNFPMVIVQNNRKAMQLFVKGKLGKIDNVLLIDDVMETGMTAHSIASKIFQQDIPVPFLLAVVDKSRGGYENLKQYGIESYSIFSLQSFCEKHSKDFTDKYKMGILPEFKKDYIDFGGFSSTNVRKHFR